MELLADGLQLGQFFELVLGVVESSAQLIGLPGLLASNAVDFFPLLALGVEVVLEILVFVFGGPEFFPGVFELALGVVEGTLELGDGLLIFLHFGLVVPVLVDLRVEAYLFALKLFNVIVLVLDEIVEAVILLGHQGDLVLKILHVDLIVLELINGLLHLAKADAVVVGLLLLAPDDLVEAVQLPGQPLVLGLGLPAPGLHPPQLVVLLLELVEGEVELLDRLDLVVELVLEHLLVLLEEAHPREGCLQVGILALPGLDLLQAGLEDAVDPVVLGLHHVELVLVGGHVVLEDLVPGQLGLLLREALLPLLDLIDLGPQQAVEAIQLLGGEVEFVAELVIVVDHLFASGGLLVEAGAAGPPLVDLLGPGVKLLAEALVVGLPVHLLLDLEVELVLVLLVVLEVVLPLPQQLVQAVEFARQQGHLVLELGYHVFVAPELHQLYLVALAALLVVVDVGIPVAQDLPQLADLVLQPRPLVLEPDRHLPDLTVHH